MNNNTTYKDSPLGKIPSDWEVKSLGQIIKLSSGKTKPNELTQISDKEYIYPVFGGNGIMGYSKEYNSEGQVILIGRVGENCGVTRFVLDKCWITDNALFTKEILLNIDIDFLTYKLQHEDISKLRSKGGQPLVSQTPIYINRISLPTQVPEQNRIAEVLSAWDKAISNMQSTIVQVELRNKWLMQELLSGKRRLKGFGGEWKEYRLGEITNNFSRRNKNLVDAKIYSVTNTNGFVLQSEHFEREIAGVDLTNYKIIKKNEFAYNPARINVGSIAYFEEEIGVISSLYVCFSTKENVIDFYLMKFLELDHTKYRIESLGEGGVRVYLWYDLFAKIKIKLPSLEEQTAIAQVLQAAANEVQVLRSKLDKLKEQKKGLMQVLLTGKKRLKIV